MKRILFISIIILLSTSSQAQDYIPFPDSLATWNAHKFEYTEPDGFITQEIIEANNYHLEGDTLINDTIYSKLFVRKSWYSFNENGPNAFSSDTNYSQIDHPYVFIGGIREDADKKVWYRNMNFENWGNTDEPFPWYYWKFYNSSLPNILEDDLEVMLYDFGVEIGDSIFFMDGDCESYWAVCNTIIEAGILDRRNYIFDNNDFLDEGITWVEGIGDISNDPFSRFDVATCLGLGFDIGKGLSCFWENGSQVYTDDEYNYPGDCEGAIFLGIEETKKQSLEIYPNPNSGLFTITLPNLGRSSVIIYNAIGMEVYQQNEISGDRYQVDFTHLPNGIYMILLKVGEEQYSTKVVKE